MQARAAQCGGARVSAVPPRGGVGKRKAVGPRGAGSACVWQWRREECAAVLREAERRTAMPGAGAAADMRSVRIGRVRLSSRSGQPRVSRPRRRRHVVRARIGCPKGCNDARNENDGRKSPLSTRLFFFLLCNTKHPPQSSSAANSIKTASRTRAGDAVGIARPVHVSLGPTPCVNWHCVVSATLHDLKKLTQVE